MWSVYMTSWGARSPDPEDEGMEMQSNPSKKVALPTLEKPGRTKSCSRISPGGGQHCGMWWYWHEPTRHRREAMRCRRGKDGRCSKYGRYHGGPARYYFDASIPERNEDDVDAETQGEILERHRGIAWQQEQEQEPAYGGGSGGRAKKRPRRTRRGRRADKTRRSRRLRHTSRRKRPARRRRRTRRWR